MGQQHFKQLKQKFIECQQQTPQAIQTHEQLIAKLQRYATQITHKQLTCPQLEQHILEYINLQIQNTNHNKKRRRSYEILQTEQLCMEETRTRSDSFSKECQIIEEKMERIEEIQELVRQNITHIMITQKPYKIRQNFRNLILNLLKIDNLLLYVLHSDGRLQYHDFKANYISYVLEIQKSKKIDDLIKEYQNQTVTNEVLRQFDLLEEAKSVEDVFKWGVNGEDHKFSFCFVWKNHSDGEVTQVNRKIIKKIGSIAMISSGEEEISIIQNYSKELLDLLQLFIHQSESQMCQSLGLGFKNIQDIHQSLLSSKLKNQPLLARVCSYQQLEFQLLQRIRTYKKYVCEGDKIFMDFNQSAQLTFLSNNFNHPLSSNLGKIVDQRKYYLQKIFQNYKAINDFLKKAVQKKIKNNKLYELDFETKARVKYDEEGRIMRLNVVIEQLQHSSSSGSNIYCNSSTKIISEGSEKQSFKDLLEQENQSRQRRPTTLIRNLQKENPGIINQGWINLFIKEYHIPGRKNTLGRDKGGKNFTVKRSFSLNHDFMTMQTEQSKQRLPQVNIQSIDLNLLQLQQEQLQPLVIKVFRKLQYYHTQHINKQYFENFLADIHNGYQIHNNPFHNFTHGVNVMHTCYLLSQPSKIRQLLTPFKLFTLIFSGLCHDVGHTGFTNLFQIASHSKKAVTYNDSSPLENFHAAYTFQLLKKPQNNFLKDITAQDMKDFRKSVINNILFTDIKEHFPLLKKFNAIIKDEIPRNDQYIHTLTSMIVHTADFGGSVKQFNICKEWSLKVNLQFSNQYKMEGQLGLPQTPFMKDLTNITILSKNEGGFLKVIVFPLYEAMDQYCGNDAKIRKLRQYAENNIKSWQQIYQKSLKQKEQEQKKADQSQSKPQVKQKHQ